VDDPENARTASQTASSPVPAGNRRSCATGGTPGGRQAKPATAFTIESFREVTIRRPRPKVYDTLVLGRATASARERSD